MPRGLFPSHLAVAGSHVPLRIYHNVGVVQVVRVRPPLLEASHGQPQAVLARQLAVPPQQRALQWLGNGQRLVVGAGLWGGRSGAGASGAAVAQGACMAGLLLPSPRTPPCPTSPL